MVVVVERVSMKNERFLDVSNDAVIFFHRPKNYNRWKQNDG